MVRSRERGFVQDCASSAERAMKQKEEGETATRYEANASQSANRG